MLKTEQTGAILLLTLDRPEKRNSLHPDLIAAMSETIGKAASDETLGVVVITGAGSSFTAGLDLNHLLSLDAGGRAEYMKSLFDLLYRIYTMPQPVIAAINGPAMAGGFDLAAVCDLRICSPAAKFAQTEVLLGITQIMYPIYKVIGLSRAKELAMTGEAIDAGEAWRIGLVNHIYSAEDLLDRAMELAAKLASRPRKALFETKRLSRELIELDTNGAFKRMFDAISERLHSEEHSREIEKYVARLNIR